MKDDEEVISHKPIMKQEIMEEMMKYLEKEEGLEVITNDFFYMQLNKRTHRYIFFFNL